MKLQEYVAKIQHIENEITGCDNLIEFYTRKKDQLQKEHERLLNLEMEAGNNEP